MRNETHLDYERARPSLRWTGGSLVELCRTLFRELEEAEAGTWVYRVLPRGAFVGARVGPQGRELRIYRRDTYHTPDGERLWRNEVLTFRNSMKLGMWDEVESPPTPGPCVTLREPMGLGV